MKMKIGDKVVIVLSDNTEHLAEITSINETSGIVRFILSECGTLGEASFDKISKPVNSSTDNKESSKFEFIEGDEDLIYKFKVVAGIENAKIANVLGKEGGGDCIIYAKGSGDKCAIEVEIDGTSYICSGENSDVETVIEKLIKIFDKNEGVLQYEDLEDVAGAFGLTFC